VRSLVPVNIIACTLVLAANAAGQLSFSPPVQVDSAGTMDFGMVAVAGGRNGVWVATWQAYGLTDTSFDSNIAHSRSTDDGLTWSAAALIDPNPTDEAGDELGPIVKSDGDGTWIAAWHSFEDVGLPSGNGPNIYVARSTDNGVSWTDPAWLHADGGTDPRGDSDVSIATDGRGTWIAVWAVTDTLGSVLGNDSDLYVARSLDNGETWETPELLNPDGTSDTRFDGLPEVRTDARGVWVIGWTADLIIGSSGDEDVYFTRSVDDGESWEVPQPLNTDAATDDRRDLSIKLTTDRVGNWIAVWDGVLAPETDVDIFYARSGDDAQTWSAPERLNTNGTGDAALDAFPTIATDTFGRWVVLWGSNDDLGGTIGTDSDVLISESSDIGLTWTAPRLLDPARNSDAADDAEREPVIATDGAGSWVSVWIQGDSIIRDRGFLTSVHVGAASAVLEVDNSSGSGSGGGCFIATAAYGTPLAHRLDGLRTLRDEHLLQSPLGTAFADAYYRLSPPLAAWIAERPNARATVRLALVPIASGPSSVAWIVGLSGVVAGVIAMAKLRLHRTLRRPCE
jgi:hypothetical protein